MHHLYCHCMYLVGTNGHMIVGQVSQLAMLHDCSMIADVVVRQLSLFMIHSCMATKQA